MKTLPLRILIFALFLGMEICLESAEANERPPIESPLSLAIQCRDGKQVAIEITNHSNEERQLVSNLPKIMESLSLGFPSQAALQLKDTKGDFIGLQGQNPDGWWYPSILSSSVDLKKDRTLEETSAVTVPAGQKVTYLLGCQEGPLIGPSGREWKKRRVSPPGPRVDRTPGRAKGTRGLDQRVASLRGLSGLRGVFATGRSAENPPCHGSRVGRMLSHG